jgi:hypothetical protein
MPEDPYFDEAYFDEAYFDDAEDSLPTVTLEKVREASPPTQRHGE